MEAEQPNKNTDKIVTKQVLGKNADPYKLSPEEYFDANEAPATDSDIQVLTRPVFPEQRPRPHRGTKGLTRAG